MGENISRNVSPLLCLVKSQDSEDLSSILQILTDSSLSQSIIEILY